MNLAGKKFTDIIKQVKNGNIYRDSFKRTVNEFLSSEENSVFLFDQSYPLNCRLFLFILAGKSVSVKIFDELKNSENLTQSVYNACIILNTLRLLPDNDLYERVQVYFKKGKDFEKIHHTSKFAYHEFKLEELKFKNDYTWREERKVPDIKKEVKQQYENISLENTAYKRILHKFIRKQNFEKICINHDIFIDFDDKILKSYCQFLYDHDIYIDMEEDSFDEKKDRRDEIIRLVKSKREKYTEDLQVKAKEIFSEYKNLNNFKEVIRTLDRANIKYIITSEWDTNSVFNLMCDTGLNDATNHLMTLEMYDEEISFCAKDYDISFGLKESEGSFSKEDLNIFLSFLREKKQFEKSGNKKIKL